MAAYLGNIKWGAQISWQDSNDNVSTKTINGLNLDETGGENADNANAAKLYTFANLLQALSIDSISEKKLVETRGVMYSG